jgi:putative acetyltransferase
MADAAEAVVIARETPDQPEVLAFLAASDLYAASLYPAESNHLLDVAALLEPQVRFLVARRAGMAIGCGALVVNRDSTAEIKRMWVAPQARGAHLGRRLLAALEQLGAAERIATLQLETGIHNTEALALYRSAGFVEIGPFGAYAPDPLSVFMEKRLAGNDPLTAT